MMQWTVRLEARTSAGKVKTTEVVTFSRPAMVSTLAEVGLVLAETKASRERLNVRTRCGCSLCAAQIRCTDVGEIPTARAIARPVQCVA